MQLLWAGRPLIRARRSQKVIGSPPTFIKPALYRAVPRNEEFLCRRKLRPSTHLIRLPSPFIFRAMLFVRAALSKGLFSFILASFPLSVNAAELSAPPVANAPKVAAASNEGEMATRGYILPPGFKIELFAAEPHLANPVAFEIDHQNRFWVAEAFRLHAGVTDIRGKNSWLDEDLASRTVEDRIAMMKRHEGEKFSAYQQNSDRLKLVLDTDHDGKADRSTVFADGFNNAADGLAAGVLSRDGQVYFANLPNLWLLQDTNDDGVSDTRKSLHYGFGVRVGFLGHDLHGLIMGPDGRLYFSIGDRGSNIDVDGKRVGQPDTGCVFRCKPDGSDLEVFAYGLRNPQELAFDQYGNLFTGDNNSDGGDRARIVYLLEGGDSGWRIGWQFLERPNARGAWNSEKMWHPQNDEQPAYIIPPITNLANGPSGFAFNPGTGLPAKYKDNFFLVDFRGGKGSGIYNFALAPKGAGFELASAEQFVWESLPTDVAFGLDGGVYFTDWVQGWGMTGKGRIYRVFEPDSAQHPVIAETRRLLMEGMAKRSNRELERLLAHVDMRVRQEAQFELVNRGAKGGAVLAKVAKSNSAQLARIHGIWGLGQLARAATAEAKLDLSKSILPLAKDQDAEIRAQVARVIGDARLTNAIDATVLLLRDASPRVRMLAAISAGKLRNPEFVPSIVKLLEENADRDPHLRHAGAFALAGIRDLPTILQTAQHPNDAVRMGGLLALRRLERTEAARFLGDRNPKIALEAARAINDIPISGATRELAALAATQQAAGLPQPFLRRVINANYRYGTAESARNLAALATSGAVSAELRAEALQDLAEWERPSGRDRVTGLWRPVVGPRSRKEAADAIEPHLVKLLQDAPARVRIGAAQTAAALELSSSAEALLALVRGTEASNIRVEALRALAALKDSRLSEALEAAQNDSNENVRKEALRFQSQLKPSGALAQIERALETGATGEKQSALATLATMQGRESDALLLTWLDQLIAGNVPANLQLDLLEAASKRDVPEIAAKLKAFEAKLAKEDELAPFRVALQGGNADEGRKIFFERAEAACVRCHTIAGQGGAEGGGQVGPELTKIGASKDRTYLMESIVFPNKHIAEGFQSLLVVTKDGTSVAGIVKSETDTELVLNSPEDGIVKIKKSEITARERGISSMPEGLSGLLSKRDLRDLVQFLSELK
jgi:quinoprotein glucose dehydrogenase